MTVVTPEKVQAPQKGWAGQNVPRKEDKRLTQGQGVFVDDVKRHGMGYLHFVRSPYAHAHITSIDVSAAEQIKGVYGTLTGEEVAALTDPFFQLSTPPGAHVKDYALAVGKVRYVGEPVVAVVAETRELARDASELVEVEYEPLPAIVDARVALDDAQPVIHEDSGSNLMWNGVYEWGDLDAAFAEADKVVKISELHFHRFNSTPLECDGAVVEYNRGTTQWTLYTNNQFPGFAQIMMGPAMRCGLDKLRFVTQDIGGGFGNKITSHPQLVVCCLLSRKLNRPVNWTEWRTDFHLSMSHGNERWFHDTEVAVKNDGTLLGFRTKALDDAGAYLRYEPLGGVIWAQVTPGMYKWRNIRLAHAAPLVHRARDRHRRQGARPRPGRGAQAQLHQARGHAVRDAERLRLRLGRLRQDARRRSRADRLERRRGAEGGGARARQAARRRDRLDARLRHQQLRPVADDQP
jgi:CO/xanthine dehydrogenase Mo-binding subunit